MLALAADTRDRWPEWGRIVCPTLVVAGGRGLARRSEMRKMSDSPNARYLELAGLGHDLHLESPDEWCRVLSEFLATVM